MTYKYYVFCPYFCTGGPEALHQLAGAIRDLGHESYIWYFGERHHNLSHKPILPAYSHYNVRTSTRFLIDEIDQADCVWILPEGMMSSFYTKPRQAQRVIWYLASYPANPSALPYDTPCLDDYYILAQSDYAYQQIKTTRNSTTNVQRLYDYTKPALLQSEETLKQERRIAQVLLNPVKGLEHTVQIRKQLPDVRFVPIKGATEDMLIDLGLKSKLYIDFGHHPGRDRLPREMASLGAIVLTGNDHVASSDVDVPLPDLKFKRGDDQRYDYLQIAKAIRSVLQNYDSYFESLSHYRTMIREERSTFYQQVDQLIRYFEP